MAARLLVCLLVWAGQIEGGSLEPAWAANPSLLAAARGWEAWLLMGDVALRNNTITPTLYETYNGAFLDEVAKRDILGCIPGDGVRGAFVAEGIGPSVRVGDVAVTTACYVGADLQVDKDLLDLAFFGNTLDRRYELANEGGVLACASVGIAHGRTIGPVVGWEVSVGAGARGVIGLGAAKVMRSEASVFTEVGGITASGTTVVRRSTAGRAPLTVALDLGGGARRGPWEIELALRDLGPSLSWAGAEERILGFEAVGWTAELGESAYTTTDTTVSVSRWSTPLPTRLRGLARRCFRWGELSLSLDQGLRRWAGVTTRPRLGLATAWEARSWCTTWVRGGFGSPEGFGLSAGAAVTPAWGRFFLEVTGLRIPPSRSKALGLRFGLGVHAP